MTSSVDEIRMESMKQRLETERLILRRWKASDSAYSQSNKRATASSLVFVASPYRLSCLKYSQLLKMGGASTARNGDESSPLKQQCTPITPTRRIRRSIYERSQEHAREIAATPDYAQSRKDRKKVEMLFAHMKRILKVDRLRSRGLSGARDEFLLTATAQNIRRIAHRSKRVFAEMAMKGAIPS